MAKRTRRCNCCCDALALAEPGGFIRLFVDEGRPMAHLLSEAAAHGMMPDYIGKLLAVFEAEEQKREDTSHLLSCPAPDRAIEPTRVRSPAAHCPGTLESGDQRAAFPRPEYGKGTQSENLWQTPGPKAHRSGRTCPRVGSVVASTLVCPQAITCQSFRTAPLLNTLTKQHSKQHFRV